MNVIKLKRGRYENLPVLAVGEPAFTTDTKELYIGTTTGNVKISADIDEINSILADYVTNTTFNALEGRVSDVETNKVSETTFDQQLLLKQETKPNGSDSLVLGNKINPVYMDGLFVTDVFTAADQSAMLSLDARRGDFAVRADVGKTFVLKQEPATTLANWVELQTTSDVVSVNGKTGAVTIEIGDLSGLQTALNGKVEATTYESEQQAQDNLIADKVDKVIGKGLSTNDFTNNYKNKLTGIAAGAEVNVQSNWDATSGDAYILNKPSVPSKTSDLTNDSGYITEAYVDIEIGEKIGDIDFSEFVKLSKQKEVTTETGKVAVNELGELLYEKQEGTEFTQVEKTKLSGIEAGAEKNTVNSVNGKTGAVVINKSDVGLPNVDNTADLDKPISTSTQDALDLKADKTQLNDYVTTSTFDMQMLEKLEVKPNGTDLLIIGGKINPLYINDTSYKVNHPTVNSQSEMLALDVPPGTVVVRLDTPSKELFLLTKLPASTLANWQVVSSSTVVSVAGKTGAVVLGITDISGLDSALNLKLDISTFESQLTKFQADVDNKVDKVSGKGLSTNDYTNTDKGKVDKIVTGGSASQYLNKAGTYTTPPNTVRASMSLTEGILGTATTPRAINAKNLKDIVLNHSPAGSRPASDVRSWAKELNRPTYNAAQVGARSSTWTPTWDDVRDKPSLADELKNLPDI